MISNPSVVPLRPLSCATVVWRTEGLLRVTVVVKGTFGLVPGGPARLVAPAQLTPAELAPFLPNAGVLVNEAIAHAPGAVPVASMTVRVRVAGERPVVDKSLYVYGDRSSPTSEPTPFAAMPITWERAVGGAGKAENPVGVGAAPGDRQPNVVHPQDARRPAGFAAIPRSWPARASRLGGLDADALAEPIAEVPDAFDFRFFQPAPADQCGPYLRGDEWIQLDGLHPALPHLLTRLPFAVAEARWSLPTALGSGPLQSIELVGDLLVLDPVQQVGSVVWRGHFTLEREELLDEVQLIAGVALPGYPIPWPEAEHATAEEETTTAVGPAELVHDRVLDDAVPEGEVQSAIAPPALPFAPALGPSPAARASALPKSVPEPAGFGETVSSLVMSPFANEALPFSRAPAPPPPPPLPPPPPSARGSEPRQALPEGFDTTAQAVSPFAKPVAPFELAPPRAGASPVAAPIPGAPWSAEPARPPPTLAASHDEPETLLIQADPRLSFVAAPALAPPPLPVSRRPDAAAGTDDGVRAKLLEKVAAREPAGDLALAGAYLSGLDLAGADLSGLDLTGADLSGANLRGASLVGANLSGARLLDADLENANLQRLGAAGADFSNAKLDGADLRQARAPAAIFEGARLPGVTAAKAELTGARFTGAILDGVNLREAKLSGAIFSRASLVGADLRDADLDQADLRGVDLKSAKLAGANLTGAREGAEKRTR